MKKPTRKSLVEKLDKVFSIYIRTRYAIDEISECYTCGVKNNYTNFQPLWAIDNIKKGNKI